MGQLVQTAFGKGIVRELRNDGRVLVDVKARALLLHGDELTVLAAGSQSSIGSQIGQDPSLRPESEPQVVRDIDFHGLTVAEALERIEQALNDAFMANTARLRLIHGRSGGRIRAALHDRLRQIAAVRRFHLDPRNPGVTIVEL